MDRASKRRRVSSGSSRPRGPSPPEDLPSTATTSGSSDAEADEATAPKSLDELVRRRWEHVQADPVLRRVRQLQSVCSEAVPDLGPLHPQSPSRMQQLTVMAHRFEPILQQEAYYLCWCGPDWPSHLPRGDRTYPRYDALLGPLHGTQAGRASNLKGEGAGDIAAEQGAGGPSLQLAGDDDEGTDDEAEAEPGSGSGSGSGAGPSDDAPASDGIDRHD